MSAFNLINKQNISWVQRSFLWQSLIGLVCLLILALSPEKSMALENQAGHSSRNHILWVSAYQDEKLDLELKGFNYSTNNQFTIDFVAANKTQTIQQKVSNFEYQYLIAVSDQAWEFINPLEINTPKIGISVTNQTVKQVKLNNKEDTYLISKEQPSRRIFAMLKAMELSRTQAASLFYKDQQRLKSDFVNQAKEFNVPFKAIHVAPQASTIELINSIYNCCRVLYLKQQDLNSSIAKLKSLLYESYRRKIITITDNKELLKHGAVYAIYSQPHQLGQQAGSLALDLTSGVAVSPLQEPHDFVIDSNHAMKNTIGGQLATTPNGTLIQKTKLSELTNTGSGL